MIKKTPEQLLAAKIKRERAKVKRDHEKLVRNMVLATGFARIASLEGQQFTYKGQQCDFDDVFIYENVIVVAEYTTSSESNVSDHLKLKKIIFDHIQNGPDDFVSFMKSSYPDFASATKTIYPDHSYRVSVLYCSRYELRVETKDQVKSARYLDYNIAKYFSNLALTIRHSARHEFLEFLGVSASEVAENVLSTQDSSGDNFRGSVLPSSHSMFDSGYKVVSFYANPSALLERVYVLRREGWRDEANLYQRVIGRKKVDLIRNYLLEKRRVFVNNIIITLPDDAKVLDDEGDTKDPDSIKKTQPATVYLPKRHNSIGIIDGQHRVYSYYEGGDNDDEISAMRQVQNLLVTGVMFPPNTSDADKLKFEAQLFVEINANQTSAPPDLMQEIDLIIRPFEPSSIAKRIIKLMNDRHSPFNNEFARYTHDVDKLKTSSIVSFGLKPIVKLSGDDSFFFIWPKPDKYRLLEGNDSALLSEYIEFCYVNVIAMFIQVRKHLASGRWTSDKSRDDRFLNTTNINGIIGFQRKLIEDRQTADIAPMAAQLAFLTDFNFSAYKSSQWNRMATDLYNQFSPSGQVDEPGEDEIGISDAPI